MLTEIQFQSDVSKADSPTQEETMSNSSTLLGDDEDDMHSLPLDECQSSLDTQSNPEPHVVEQSTRAVHSDQNSILPMTTNSNNEPHPLSDSSANNNNMFSNSSVIGAPLVSKVTTAVAKEESEFHSDPVMSVTAPQHPPLLFSQVSDPSGYGLNSAANQPFAMSLGHNRLASTHSYIAYRNEQQQQLPRYQNQHSLNNDGHFQYTDSPPFPSTMNQYHHHLHHHHPQQPQPQLVSLAPVSSFIGGSEKQKKKSSKKVAWTDYLWKPKGSSSADKSTKEARQRSRFANLNPSADKVTSRTKSSSSATRQFFSFSKKPAKSDKHNASMSSEGGGVSSESGGASNNLEYLQPQPSSSLTDAVEASSSYINLKTKTGSDCIESNYNTDSVSSVYAADSSDTDGSVIYQGNSNYVNSEMRIPGSDYYNGIPTSSRTDIPLDEIIAECSKDDKKTDVNKGSGFITNLSADEFVQNQLNYQSVENSVSENSSSQSATLTKDGVYQNGLDGSDQSVNSQSLNSVLDDLSAVGVGGETEGGRGIANGKSEMAKKRKRIYFNEVVKTLSAESLAYSSADESSWAQVEKEREEQMRSIIKSCLEKQPTRSILRRSATSRNPDHYSTRPASLLHSASFDGYPGFHRYSLTDSLSSTDDSSGSNPSIPFIDDEKGSQLSVYDYEDPSCPSAVAANLFSSSDPRLWSQLQQNMIGQASRAVFDDDADLDSIDCDSDTTETEDEENDSVVYHHHPPPTSSNTLLA